MTGRYISHGIPVVELGAGMRLFAGLLAVMVAVACVGPLPDCFDFYRFLFGDAGWALTTNRLLDDGLLPTRDFAYFYGLLTLSVDRASFAVFGATPTTVGGLMLACAVLIGVGVWRVANVLRLGPWPRLLLLPLVPLVIDPSQLHSPAHALEPALLLNAIAFQARGKLATALALATVSVLVKPGFGYLYGFLVVGEILLTPVANGGWRIKRLVPAAGVGLLLLAHLAFAFGAEAVWKTQVPTEPQKLYRDSGFGFFGPAGEKMWKPPPGQFLLHFGTRPPGVWLTATAVLLAGGLVALFRLRRDPAARVVATMAVLHGVFVAAIYSTQWAYTYYPFLPVVGAAVLLDRLPSWTNRSVGRGLAVGIGGLLGGLGLTLLLFGTVRHAVTWQKLKPDARAAGLFTTPPVAEYAAEMRARAADGGALVLTPASSARVLVPGLDSPRSWFLHRSILTPGDLARLREDIARCRWLIVPDSFHGDILAWPELADVLAPFRKADRGPGFDWYRRAVSPGP